jgi:hypothetical protein
MHAGAVTSFWRSVVLGVLALACSGKESAAPVAPEEIGDLDVDAAARPDSSRDFVGREAAAAPGPANGPIAPWAEKDVGAPPAAPAEVRSSTGLMTVRAGGVDVGGAADSFHFVSQKVRGDFELVGRVRSLQMVDPESKAGLMVRANDADPGAANVFLTTLGDPSKGGAFQQRLVAGGPTTVRPDTGVRPGQWLRITRQGRTLTAFRSAARLSWIKVGSVDLDLPVEVVAGVAVAAKSATATTTAEIDALRLQSLGAPPVTRDWTVEDLGTIGASALWDGGTLALSGVGEVQGLLSESGAYFAGTASGNQALTVKVAAFTHKDPAARVALMIREGPPVLFARTQPAVLLSLSSGLGLQFQSRVSSNLTATLAVPKDVKAPVWLRLERVEDPGPPLTSRFVGSYSLDGQQWIVVGMSRFALPEPYLVGVLAGSNGSTTPAMATLTDLTLAAPSSPPPAPDAGRPADAAGDGK